MSTALQDAEAYFSETSPEDVVSAYLFGSQARGTAHRDSNVDVGGVPWTGGACRTGPIGVGGRFVSAPS